MSQKITTYIFCVFLVILACLIQSFSYLGVDSSWLADSAVKLLSGKDLYVDFIETNPPFIVYLTVIPVWLGDQAGLLPQHSFKLFTFVVLIGSFVRILKYPMSDFFKIILTFGLFVMPAHNFGQREHLFLALLMPYFLSLLNDRRPAGVDVAMATVGFLIKPYFVVFFVGFVLWQVVSQKRSLFLKENFVIGFSLVAYVAAIWVFEREYITDILPLLLKYYGNFYLMQLGYYTKLFVFFLLVLSIRTRFSFNKKTEDVFLNEKLSFVIYSAFLAGVTLVIQDKGWVNHYMPLYFFLFLAIAMFIELAPKRIVYFLLGLLLFVMVHIFLTSFMTIFHVRNSTYKEMVIEVFDEYAAGREVVEMSADLGALYPEVIYSKASFNWEYPHMWIFYGMYNVNGVAGKNIEFRKPEEQTEDEAKIFKSFVNYVITKKPAVIVSNNLEYFKGKKDGFYFDYIKYFSQDPAFAAQFAKYRFLKVVGIRKIYVLDEGKV